MQTVGVAAANKARPADRSSDRENRPSGQQDQLEREGHQDGHTAQKGGEDQLPGAHGARSVTMGPGGPTVLGFANRRNGAAVSPRPPLRSTVT